MTYPDALAYLSETRRFGMKLGLDLMRQIAEELGRPQDRLKFIHLAGTNGKGSTAAFCESCLRSAGFRAGLYTSPHLVSLRERIQINRQSISEHDFAEGVAEVRRAVQELQVSEPTFFEILTAVALWYFAREKVEWVVWETGLGGRLDATNIVTPEICIITNIDLEHTQYLGDTLTQIAVEKAGIIKEGVPVVSGLKAGNEAASVIRAVAEDRHAPLILAPGALDFDDVGLRKGLQVVRIAGREYPLGLAGAHQQQNAVCAYAAINALRLPQMTNDHIARGLAETRWPGRFEVVSESPLMVIDGAHNPAAVTTLVKTWQEFLMSRLGEKAPDAHLVFASVADKDLTEMAGLLRPLAHRVSLVRLMNERSSNPAAMEPFFTGLPTRCYESVADLWRDLQADISGQPVLMTGSLFLVGEILAQRDGAAEEFRLNERLEARR